MLFTSIVAVRVRLRISRMLDSSRQASSRFGCVKWWPTKSPGSNYNTAHDRTEEAGFLNLIFLNVRHDSHQLLLFVTASNHGCLGSLYLRLRTALLLKSDIKSWLISSCPVYYYSIKSDAMVHNIRSTKVYKSGNQVRFQKYSVTS